MTLNSLKKALCALSFLALACGTPQVPPSAQTAQTAPTSSPSKAAPAPPSYPAKPAPRSDSSFSEAEAPASPPAGDAQLGRAEARASGASGAPARSPKASRPTEPLDLERERPGLGTTWGETRESRVSSAHFDRARPLTPFALLSVHYNDRAGVSAMLRDPSLSDFRHDGVPTARGLITVRVVDENGFSLPTLVTPSRNLVVGEHGARYAIEIQNHSDLRFEAVVTVDGLDVIDGRPGSFSKRGYLVQPFSTVTIDGYRRSLDEVAAFRFGSAKNSYSAQKGDDRNVGVIGVALFEEQNARFPWTEREIERRERANPFPGRFAEPPIVR